MLEFERACKLYSSPGGAVRAVDDVSLDVGRGELVTVFGPSGSGKTTLLLLAAGLLRLDAGSVRFEGRDLAALSRQELLGHRRTRLGFVSQRFNLVTGLTAAENVALPLLLCGVSHRRAHERALAALEEIGLANRRRHTPAMLSGGEQQRVAVARALVTGPKLVLADEPTGNLDSQTGDGVLDLLGTMARERDAAVVLVTHDARGSRYADRVLGMRDGRLTELDLEAQAVLSR